MFNEMRRIFFVGILSLAPVALTVYVLIALAQWFDALFQPILSPFLPRPIPGLGIILGILCILLAGLLAPSLIGKQFLLVTDKIMEKLPLSKLVYSGTKQIFDSFSHSGLGKFNRVVMVEFPKADSYSVGFVTQEIPGGWVPGKKSISVAVFVPTTPNPTSGYLIFVPPESIIPVSMTTEEALKLVISGGIVRPPAIV